MIHSRQGELLDATIATKQKILREPSSDFKQPIRKDPLNEITTLLNLIGKKLDNGRRITRDALTSYFDRPLQQVIKSALEPLDPTTNDEIIESRTAFRRKVDNFRKTRLDSGPNGIYRLITPLPPPNRRAANWDPDSPQNQNPNADDNISHLTILSQESSIY